MAIYGIKAVKYCLSKNLLHYVEADAGGGHTQDIEVFNPATGKCTVTNPLTTLPCLIGTKATLTVDDAVVNRRHQYTARLTFVTATDPELDGEYYAFVVETNEGERMLLGSKVAPRCSVTTRQNVAATAGDINGYTTTVDFKAPYAPLRLPVTTEPVPDTREFDICCGAIAQPQQPDTREFDVCCGQIAQPPVPDTREFTICCGEIQTKEPISGPEYDVCCGEIAQPVEPDTRKFDICCGEVVGIVPDPFPRPNPYPVALPTKQTSHAMEELLKNTVNQYIYHYYSLDGLSLFRYSLGLPHAEEAWQWYDQRSRRKIVFSEFTNRDAWSEYRKTLDDTYNSDTVTDVITDERVVGFQTQEWQSEYRDLLRFIADFMPTADQWLILEMAALNFPEIEFEYSIDGTSKIESGNNTADNNGINISLYVPKTISYFKIKEDDYTKYLFSQCQFSFIDSFGNSWEGKNIHPIFSAYKEGLQIGFYTDEWQGTI